MKEVLKSTVFVLFALLFGLMAAPALAGETGKLLASGGNEGVDRADLYDGVCFAPVSLAQIELERDEIIAKYRMDPEPKAAVYTDLRTNVTTDGCWFFMPGPAVVLVWNDGAVAVLGVDEFEDADEGSPQSK